MSKAESYIMCPPLEKKGINSFICLGLDIKAKVSSMLRKGSTMNSILIPRSCSLNSGLFMFDQKYSVVAIC